MYHLGPLIGLLPDLLLSLGVEPSESYLQDPAARHLVVVIRPLRFYDVLVAG